jgi:hypothetical protein
MVAADPALEVTQATADDRTLTCLGYLLDPRRPDAGNSDILHALLREARSADDLIARLDTLGGRWVLISNSPDECLLLTDATGLRRVFFAAAAGSVWCASQPEMLAGALGLTADPEAAAFIAALQARNAAQTRRAHSLWWPGTGTPYVGVRHLTPNHVLDLGTGEARRFFPRRPREERPLEAVVAEAAPLLQGMIAAAVHRFESITLMMTGGLDSRLILAAARPYVDSLRPVTIASRTGNKRDVPMTAELLDGLGLPHTIAEPPTAPDPAFRAAYDQRTLISNDHFVANAEALQSICTLQSVTMTGNNAEIFAAFYRLPTLAGRLRRPNAALLTQLLPEMYMHPYATRLFGQWFDELGDTHGYSPLDLVYWELRAGNWLANWLAAYDLIWRDCVVPLNSRELLVTLLAAPEEQRKKPKKQLNRALIAALWPEMPLRSAHHTEVRKSARERLANMSATARREIRFLRG